MRLNKIIQFLKSTDDIKAGLKIFKMVLFLTVYIHCFTCVWWLIVGKTKIWISPLDSAHPEFYYAVYSEGIFKQYLTSLHTAVQTLLGSGVLPRDTIQTLVCAIGIFMGAIINANIFGELALIFAELGKAEKLFQRKMAHVNTAMINLKLPFEL